MGDYVDVNYRLSLHMAFHRKGRAHPYGGVGYGERIGTRDGGWGVMRLEPALHRARLHLAARAAGQDAWRVEISVRDGITGHPLGHVATIWADGRETVHDAGLIERLAGGAAPSREAFPLAALMGAD